MKKMNKTSHSIYVENLGVKFYLNYENDPEQKKRSRRKEFWAIKDISFSTEGGEIFGVIGCNGAGKSTLLKVIAGIFPPTTGTVAVNGNIAPMLELGAAINPELTGRENIFLTGAIYLVPKIEIKEKYDRIVEFSGLRKFIDIPVKNYSSGMFMRLAFSSIIFFRPDIILIDEVFSVGDETFQQKSFEKILSFRKQGATILLVSHDANLISQICDRAMILDNGRLSFLGPAAEAVEVYHSQIRSGKGLETDTRLPQKKDSPEEAQRWGNKMVEIKGVEFVDAQGRPQENFSTGDYFEARLRYLSALKNERPVFGVSISTIYKLLIYGPNTLSEDTVKNIPEQGIVRFIIPQLPLLEGDYLFSAAAYDDTLNIAYDHHDMMYHFRVSPLKDSDFGSVKIKSEWDIREE